MFDETKVCNIVISLLVLDAFSKAHDRMRLARENALGNLRELALDETNNVAGEVGNQPER